MPNRRATDDCDADDKARASRQEVGHIVIAPWIVTLMVSLGVQLIGAAYVTGTAITRIEALTTRIQRLEQQIDGMQKLRSPINYTSPPIIGIGRRAFGL